MCGNPPLNRYQRLYFPYTDSIGHFQSIKTGVLLIFSFITGYKTEFPSANDVFKRIHNWNLTFRIVSDQFLAFVC